MHVFTVLPSEGIRFSSVTAESITLNFDPFQTLDRFQNLNSLGVPPWTKTPFTLALGQRVAVLCFRVSRRGIPNFNPNFNSMPQRRNRSFNAPRKRFLKKCLCPIETLTIVKKFLASLSRGTTITLIPFPSGYVGTRCDVLPSKLRTNP